MCLKKQQISDNLIVKDYCFIIEIFDKFSFSGILRGCLKGKSGRKQFSSNERAKMQKNEPSLTSMRQMVLEISHFKDRILNKMDVSIL